MKKVLHVHNDIERFPEGINMLLGRHCLVTNCKTNSPKDYYAKFKEYSFDLLVIQVEFDRRFAQGVSESPRIFNELCSFVKNFKAPVLAYSKEEESFIQNIYDMSKLRHDEFVCVYVNPMKLVQIALKLLKIESSDIIVRKPKVFISYAKEDLDLASHIYDCLSIQGYICWMDTHNLLPGENWDMTITNAINNHDFVVLILSKNSVTKEGYVQKEVKEALRQLEYKPDNTIYILPVLVGNIEIPTRIKHLHCISVNKNNNMHVIRQLSKAIDLGFNKRAIKR